MSELRLVYSAAVVYQNNENREYSYWDDAWLKKGNLDIGLKTYDRLYT